MHLSQIWLRKVPGVASMWYLNNSRWGMIHVEAECVWYYYLFAYLNGIHINNVSGFLHTKFLVASDGPAWCHFVVMWLLHIAYNFAICYAISMEIEIFPED